MELEMRNRKGQVATSSGCRGELHQQQGVYIAHGVLTQPFLISVSLTWVSLANAIPPLHLLTTLFTDTRPSLHFLTFQLPCIKIRTKEGDIYRSKRRWKRQRIESQVKRYDSVINSFASRKARRISIVWLNHDRCACSYCMSMSVFLTTKKK